METIKIENLYRAAKIAYHGISFDPEKRAENIVSTYEAQLNDDVSNMPESEISRYIDGYKSHLFAWLSAKSRTMSAMITGPARFPVDRNNKAMNVEMKRLNEFSEWREKSLKSISKKVEDSKPEDQKNAEALKDWKMQVDRLFDGFLVDRFRSRLETVARTGNVDLVKSVLDYFSDQQKERGRVLATPRHGVWSVAELAKKYRLSIDSVKEKESEESEINGVRIVKNHSADRLQLFFDGKPSSEIILKLKANAFRWSPSNGCWQRQLTNNAIWAAKRLLA